jgi:hypothetical protein
VLTSNYTELCFVNLKLEKETKKVFNMTPDLFYHPLHKNKGQNVDDALLNKRNVVGTICETNGSGNSYHAATLFKKENNNYVFKNSYPSTPQITIPANQMPFNRKISKLLEIFKILKIA